MIIRAKAPLRVSFGGGGTDVPPYPAEHGGAVLNATINKYAYVSIVPCDENVLAVQSLDYDLVARYDLATGLRYDGELDLVKAAIRRMNVAQGLHLFLHNDAPPGSGLGSSSAIVVALVTALGHLLKAAMTDYEIAQLAYEIERVELGIKGGLQDQYAAAFGGFNFMEFGPKGTIVNPLRIRPEVVRELEYHLLLCYTGKVRPNANIIDDQMKAYDKRAVAVVDALHTLKALAYQMRNAILRGQLMDFGLLMHEAWETKKHLARQITDATVERLYAAAREAGAIGGKLLGAGGGGYLLVFVPFHKRHVVAGAMVREGGSIVPFNFVHEGVVAWEVENYLAVDGLSGRGGALSDAEVRPRTSGRVVGGA